MFKTLTSLKNYGSAQLPFVSHTLNTTSYASCKRWILISTPDHL